MSKSTGYVPDWVKNDPELSTKGVHWWMNISYAQNHNPVRHGVRILPGFRWEDAQHDHSRPKMKKFRRRQTRVRLKRELQNLVA